MSATMTSTKEVPKKTQQVNMLIESELKELIDNLASREQRSVSAMVRFILAQKLNELIDGGYEFPRGSAKAVKYVQGLKSEV